MTKALKKKFAQANAVDTARARASLRVVGDATKNDDKARAPFYELLFEEANDALLLVDTSNWNIVTANKRLQELTGFLKKELEGHTVNSLFPKATGGDRASNNFRTIPLAESVLKTSGFYEDVALQKKDGYLAYVSLSVRTLSSTETGDRAVTLCILRDTLAKRTMERDLITKHSELRNAYAELERANIEIKSAQEALVQAGKLAALGELSAGVAHELNQPLTGIMGFAQELQLQLKDGGAPKEQIEFCEEIHRNGIRMTKIIRELREFTRKSTEDYQESELRHIIQESFKLLEAQFRTRGIDVKVHCPDGIPKIYCNPFKLEQVFINLATNARDAIQERGLGHGKIDISVQWPAPLSKDQSDSGDDRFIQITFTDNGCGMSEITKSRAFDPFFTTKEVGSGTGLGLSLSYGILSQIHATMMIESSIGKGTTFYLKLPIDYRKLTSTERDQ